MLCRPHAAAPNFSKCVSSREACNDTTTPQVARYTSLATAQEQAMTALQPLLSRKPGGSQVFQASQRQTQASALRTVHVLQHAYVLACASHSLSCTAASALAVPSKQCLCQAICLAAGNKRLAHDQNTGSPMHDLEPPDNNKTCPCLDMLCACDTRGWTCKLFTHALYSSLCNVGSSHGCTKCLAKQTIGMLSSLQTRVTRQHALTRVTRQHAREVLWDAWITRCGGAGAHICVCTRTQPMLVSQVYHQAITKLQRAIPGVEQDTSLRDTQN